MALFVASLLVCFVINVQAYDDYNQYSYYSSHQDDSLPLYWIIAIPLVILKMVLIALCCWFRFYRYNQLATQRVVRRQVTVIRSNNGYPAPIDTRGLVANAAPVGIEYPASVAAAAPPPVLVPPPATVPSPAAPPPPYELPGLPSAAAPPHALQKAT